MTSILLAQTPASPAKAALLRQELRNKGYTLPEYPPLEAPSASERVERAIVGSAAVVLLWESSAVSPQWEALHIGTAQRFQKLLFPVLLDATPLPDTLAALPTLSGQLPVGPTIAALLTLPGFPPSRSTDPLLLLHEEATHELIRVRRAAIGKAAAMLAQDQHRDALLRLLTYLADHDPTSILQKEAGNVLFADAQKRTPKPPFSPVEAALMVGGHCEKGHLSHYNRRVICQEYRERVYAPTTGQDQRDELLVPCQEPGCPLKVVVHVDCGAYR